MKSLFFCVVSIVLLASVCNASEGAVQSLKSYPVAAHGAQVSAYLSLNIDDFSSAPIDLLNQKAINSATVPAVTFLTTYYQYAKQGNRAKVLESFSDELRPSIAKRYASSKDMQREFESLKAAKLLAVLRLRTQQFALVEHVGLEKNGQQRDYSWVHVLRCEVNKCLITEDQEQMQFASNIFALLRGKTSLPQPLPKFDGFETIQITDQVGGAMIGASQSPNITFHFRRPSAKLSALAKEFGVRAAKVLSEESLDDRNKKLIVEIVDGTNWPSILVLPPKGSVAHYSLTAFQDLIKKGEEFDARHIFEIGKDAFIGVYMSPKSGRIFIFPLTLRKSLFKLSAAASAHPLYGLLSSEAGQKSLLASLSSPVKK